MAKMMKKWMALAIALSLMVQAIPLPTSAADSRKSGVQTVTVDLRNHRGRKIGEKTIKTTTDVQDSPSSYQEKVTTESSWTSQDSESTTADPVQSGNTTTEVTGTVVTDVTGSETFESSTTHDKNTDVEVHAGSNTGSETTTVTDTTTTVTTTTDTQLSQSTDGPTTTMDNVTKEGEWSDVKRDEEGQWTQTGYDNPGYQLDGEVKTGPTETTDLNITQDPWATQDATLTMIQGKNEGKASEQLFIPINDIMNDAFGYTDGQVLEDGSVVSVQTDDKGNITGYILTKTTDTTPAGSNTGEIKTTSTGDLTPDSTTTVYTKPEGYTEGTEDILDETGAVIGTRTTEAILDDSGNIIGYNITEVTATPSGNLPQASTQELPAPADTWTLPEKPVANPPVTRQGMTTTQTVEEIYDENGTLVGYDTITVVTDEDGNEASRESVKIYGTRTTYTSTLQSNPESDEVTTTTVTTVYGTHTTQNYTQTFTGSSTNVNTRTLTQDTYELLQTEEGIFLLVEGQVYQVVAGEGHGTVTMTSLQPDTSISPAEGKVNTSTDLRGPEKFTVGNSLAAGYDVQYVGYGLESRIRVLESNGTSTLPHQFVLKDANGNSHYVYCVDLNTSAIRGTSYNMVNVKDSGYFESESIAKKVEAIAITGYWGTTSGTGSLENLKQYMRNNKHLHNLTDAEIDSITEGIALTATQAALWEYGHSVQAEQLGSNVTGPVYSSNSNSSTTRNPYDDETKLVNAIFSALTQIDTSKINNQTTELLNTENFATETSLVIKEKATNEDGSVKTRTDNAGNVHEVYMTDIQFTLDVKSSDLTGNLVVTVTDELGNTLATRQLVTEDSNIVGKILAGESSTEVFIEDVELAEGVKINLNLTGTQNLQEGAYLYTAEVYSTSQTFISVASGQQQVNLNVQMQFDVTDPNASIQHTSQTWDEKEVSTTSFSRTDKLSKERTGAITNQEVTVTTKVTGTLIQTDVKTSATKSLREWFSNYRYELTTTDDEDTNPPSEPTDPSESTEPTELLEEIPEEEVPLASVPKTGDVSVYWLLSALLFLAGAVALSRKKTII